MIPDRGTSGFWFCWTLTGSDPSLSRSVPVQSRAAVGADKETDLSSETRPEAQRTDHRLLWTRTTGLTPCRASICVSVVLCVSILSHCPSAPPSSRSLAPPPRLSQPIGELLLLFLPPHQAEQLEPENWTTESMELRTQKPRPVYDHAQFKPRPSNPALSQAPPPALQKSCTCFCSEEIKIIKFNLNINLLISDEIWNEYLKVKNTVKFKRQRLVDAVTV